MCRKTIDQSSTLCPYCRSDTNYQYFIEISDAQIIKGQGPFKASVSFIITMIIAGLIGILGMLLAGFWIGIGLIMGVAAFGGMIINIIFPDKIRAVCCGCGHEDEYKIDKDMFDKVVKTADFLCAACKQKMRIIALPNTTKDVSL